MAGNVITGFSSAAPSRGVVIGNGTANRGAGQPGNFDALLGAMPSKGNELLAGAIRSALGAVGAARPDPTASQTTPKTPALDAVAGAEISDAAKPLLEDLLEVLTALEAALQSGQPVDPELQQRLDTTLDALAAFLTLPQAPATTPPTGDAALDPLLALAGAAAPAAAPEDAGQSQPLLARLAKKLDALGAGLHAATPDLAAKLQALGQQLAAGTIDPQKLAALGLDPDATLDPKLQQALEALLVATPSAKPAATPPAFTNAALTLPPDTALAGRQPVTTAPAPDDTASKPANEPGFTPPAANRAPKGDDTAEQRTPARNTFASAMAAAEQAGADSKPTVPIGPTAATAPTIAAGAKAIHAAYQAPVQQPNVPQIAFEMVRQFQAGNSRFQIRLDPPELGRIDVRMDLDRDGNVLARMTVERSETLDLMQRDQRALERALAQAGLDGSKTNLEFSLRQQSSGREQGDGNGQSPFAGGPIAEVDESAPAPIITQYRGSASPSGLNLFV